MSNNYTVFNNLVNDISAKTGMEESEISKLVGRNHGYISQLRSRYKNHGEEPSEKFIEHLRLHFYSNGKIIIPHKDKLTDKKHTVTVEEKESELQGLIKVTQVFADAHLGLVRSHEILNENHKTALAQNDVLIRMADKEKVQVNLNSRSDNFLISEDFAVKLAEALSQKYSLSESDVRKDIGRTLFALQETMK